MTPSPWRASRTVFRTALRPTRSETWCWRALGTATENNATPATTTAIRLVTAHSGMCAVLTTYRIKPIAATRSKTRWAKTVPRSVGHVPSRSGSFRLRTATRASSPIRPGRTAFANSPIEKAENTSENRGCGSGIAWVITVRQAIARTRTESRFSPTAAATQRDRKSTRLNSSHVKITYDAFCLKKKNPDDRVQPVAAELDVRPHGSAGRIERPDGFAELVFFV